jgi:hypothetical protein
MSDDKIEEIRITLALNPKQIAERILSGEVNSDSHFVSQEDHLHVASLLDAAHREIAKLSADNERLRDVLRRIGMPDQNISYCWDGHEIAVLIARKALEAKP